MIAFAEAQSHKRGFGIAIVQPDGFNRLPSGLTIISIDQEEMQPDGFNWLPSGLTIKSIDHEEMLSDGFGCML